MKNIKPVIVTSAVVCCVAAAATIVSLNPPKAPSIRAPAVESSPAPAEQTPPEPSVDFEREQPRPVSGSPSEPIPTPVPDRAKAALTQAVGFLASPQTTFSYRRALLKQLKDAGELDQAIAALTDLAAKNPTNAEIPTALGEALLSKFPLADYAQAAALGLQIDQTFDAALAIDPTNWEAQFYKADSMSYWPDEAGKGPEVIQRLSSLVSQQETMPSQPQFAQTYLVLGDQYQKAGQAANAQSTWQLGLTKFPNDPGLQARLAGPPNQ
jgi:tetratricopeptide (TPR) repeat protein